MPAYYPVFLDLREQKCLVVGGGSVAERKVRSLVASGAKVTVISPFMEISLRQLAKDGAIEAIERGYRSHDADGFFLVVAATDDRETNHQVFSDVETRNGLVNTVDDQDHCRFIVPSVIERGSLTVAIGTGGKSPAFARQMREEIEAVIPEEYADYLEQVAGLRRKLREALPDPAARESAWRALMNGGLLQLLKDGQLAEAERRIKQAAKGRQ